MQLRANDFNDLVAAKKAYTSHEIQDEMLKIMSHQIYRSILKHVYTSKWYSVSVDETVDASLTEQVYIKSFIHTTHKHIKFITNETTANQLTCLIKDLLIRSSLPLNDCCFQCYDGAANMSGRHSGVATQIQQLEAQALYMHCMGHCLNLAVLDTCRSIKIMRDAFDTVLELSNKPWVAVVSVHCTCKAGLVNIKRICLLLWCAPGYHHLFTMSLSHGWLILILLLHK